jgi:quinol-cytochrome oxidoreductase complex cytochrome b subunit
VAQESNPLTAKETAGEPQALRARSTVYPTTPGYQEEELELFFPHEVLKFGIIIAVVSAGLTFLASLIPMPVGEPADPLRTPAGIEPEWYFLAVYQILKYVPRWLGVGFSFIVFPVLLLAVPFLWGPITRYRWGRAILNTVVGLGAIAALTFTLLGFLGFE